MAQITNEEDAKFVADLIRTGKLTGERMEAAFVALEDLEQLRSLLAILRLIQAPFNCRLREGRLLVGPDKFQRSILTLASLRLSREQMLPGVLMSGLN